MLDGVRVLGKGSGRGRHSTGESGWLPLAGVWKKPGQWTVLRMKWMRRALRASGIADKGGACRHSEKDTTAAQRVQIETLGSGVLIQRGTKLLERDGSQAILFISPEAGCENPLWGA